MSKFSKQIFFLIVALLLSAHSLVFASEDIQSYQARVATEARLNHINRGDLNFFFDQIYYKDGAWEFKLSRNTQGMMWRMRTKSSDLTGACSSGQTVEVKDQGSLEVKQKDMVLLFSPIRPERFLVRLKITTKINGATSDEGREAFLDAYGSGYKLLYAEE